MSQEKCCRTCEAYRPSHPKSKTGYCRRKSPTPMLIGIQQTPTIPGLNGARPAKPIVQGFFPPVDETISCLEWIEREQNAKPASAPLLLTKETTVHE